MVRNGEIVIRTMMNLSLTADHRVIDGRDGSKFLKRIAELLENPTCSWCEIKQPIQGNPACAGFPLRVIVQNLTIQTTQRPN